MCALFAVAHLACSTDASSPDDDDESSSTTTGASGAGGSGGGSAAGGSGGASVGGGGEGTGGDAAMLCDALQFIGSCLLEADPANPFDFIHSCTDLYGAIFNPQENCVGAGGLYSSAPCEHSAAVGQCEWKDRVDSCSIAWTLPPMTQQEGQETCPGTYAPL